jgi:DNA-binding LacI/PurR family transcriptional regulator
MNDMKTMHDVARHAGVSQSTVSLVLNDRLTNVKISEETRQRVLQAVEEIGYRPNLSARSMKNRRSGQVGVLVENNPLRRHTHPLAWEFILGINEGLEQGEHIMSLIRLTDVAQDGHFKAQALQGHLLDGLIVVNYIPPEVEQRVEVLVSRCVWVDGNVWRDDLCLRRDEIHAGETAAQSLLDLGYQELLCVHGPLWEGAHYSFEQRLEGIRRAATEAGIEVLEFVPEDREHMPDLLPLLRPDVGVIALDTYLLNGLTSFFAEAGVRPGTDFALICCDDDFQDVPYRCETSRISFDRFEMGRQAAQMMLQLLQSPDAPCPSRLLRGTLQLGSTTPPRPPLKGN